MQSAGRGRAADDHRQARPFARGLLHRRRRPAYTNTCCENREDLAGTAEVRSRVCPARRPTWPSRAFHNGDKIVQIDDVPVDSYAQVDAQLARKADQKITVTVERAVR